MLLVQRSPVVGGRQLQARAAVALEEVDHGDQDRGADAAPPQPGVNDHVADHPERPVGDSAADTDHTAGIVDDHGAGRVRLVEDGSQRPLVDRPADRVAQIGNAGQVVGSGRTQGQPIGECHRSESLVRG